MPLLEAASFFKKIEHSLFVHPTIYCFIFKIVFKININFKKISGKMKKEKPLWSHLCADNLEEEKAGELTKKPQVVHIEEQWPAMLPEMMRLGCTPQTLGLYICNGK